MIYLMFVTGYALTDIADKYRCINSLDGNISTTGENCSCIRVNNSPYRPVPSSLSRDFFIGFGRYAIVFLGILSLIIEVSSKRMLFSY